ncbi:hypothetical protein L3X38_039849 [Prunus dulcis]|uniref:Uncharacterized protein n=1 Tax=Prunus dulcis TaxID=3755 RepID=A0AAD4V963_PRUDU|nr:hypothetical protein L3X38_039849 [Prunus dulcis]
MGRTSFALLAPTLRRESSISISLKPLGLCIIMSKAVKLLAFNAFTFTPVLLIDRKKLRSCIPQFASWPQKYAKWCSHRRPSNSETHHLFQKPQPKPSTPPTDYAQRTSAAQSRLGPSTPEWSQS